MQERLIVKNFGPIKDVDLDLRKTTIFIGEQASGKSTLAKLIGMFRFSTLFKLNMNEDEGETSLFGHLNQYNILSYLKENTEIHYLSDFLELKIIGKRLKVISNKFYDFTNGNNLLDIFNKIPSIEFKSRFVNNFKEADKISNEFYEELENNPMLKYEFEKILRNSTATTYIPAERILIPIISNSLFSFYDSAVNLPKTLTTFGAIYERERRTYWHFKIDFLNLKYDHTLQGEKIIKNGNTIDLKDASTGLQSAIPLIIVVDSYSKRKDGVRNAFIIEEPELNLYPTTQHDLMKFIISKCTKENQNLTITTHSPYILSTLNVLLMAYQAGQEHEEEVNEIIPKESWLNPNEFNIYFVEKGGTVRNIFDRTTGLIAESELDDVSLKIGDEFDTLMEFYSYMPA